MAFECKVEIPNVQGLEPNVLTVGREFVWSCAGTWPGWASEAGLRFFLEPQHQYSLKLLRAEKVSPDTLELLATTYTHGQVDLPNVIFGTETEKVELGPLHLEVRSVQDPQNPVAEPYGPLGPIGIGVPLVYWLILAAVILALVSASGFRWLRYSQRRRLLEKMREHDSPLSPIAEFHQNIRRLQRQRALYAGTVISAEEPREVMKELERFFRIFFLRKFRLPAFDWSDRVLLGQFRRQHKNQAKENAEALRKLLKEFAAARTASSVEAKDVIQLTDHARNLAEKIERGVGER